MNLISLVASVQAPNGLWSILINWLHKGIGNFGWTIFLVTILTKVITLPFDFWTKLESKKTSLIKQKCAPQVAKIKKKFGANQQAVRVQTNSLYKREGLKNGVAGCLVMILNLIIFFTFFSSVRSNSAYQAITQYETLHTAYNEASVNFIISKDAEITEVEYPTTTEAEVNKFIDDYFKGKTLSDENKGNPSEDEIKLINLYQKYSSLFSAVTEYQITNSEEATTFINDYFSGKSLFDENKENPTEDETKLIELYQKYSSLFNEVTEYSITNNEEATIFVNDYFSGKTLQEENKLVNLYKKYTDLITETHNTSAQAVVDKWDEIKSSWLWIENIWVADAPIYPFQTFEDFVSITKKGGKNYSTYVAENINEAEFSSISTIVNGLGGRTKNGFFILAALAAVATFLTQYVADLHNKVKNKKAKNALDFSMAESLEMSMKIMKIIMPIIMMIFVLTSTASFGIYIVASNLASLAFGEIVTIFVNKLTHKKQLEVEAVLEKEANRLIKKGKIQEKK